MFRNSKPIIAVVTLCKCIYDYADSYRDDDEKGEEEN